MAMSQYPSDDQFAGLLQVATAAADAQQRNITASGKRKRDHSNDDESFIDTQLRSHRPESGMTDLQAGSTLQSSAAVLFREPSEKSKKYSRPPLGKVYSDLELAPENFLRLQTAAKAFMLDEDHLERRNVVGQKKHSNDNDVAKLKLWNCVEQFLDEDDNGETYFGHHAGADTPDTPPRTFYWPDDRNVVIKKCMPLFRKMVTNERQRIYASETRKQDPLRGGEKARKGASTDQEHVYENGVYAQESAVQGPHGYHAGSQGAAPSIYASYNPSPALMHVNVVSKVATNRRLAPRITMPLDSVDGLQALLAEVEKRHDLSENQQPDNPDEPVKPVVKVWLDSGMVEVKDDGEWMVAQLSARSAEWMDRELRVLVEI